MVTWSVYTVKADSDEFQSTPSLRMVTKEAAAEAAPAEISIHTILADGDKKGQEGFDLYISFQSTPSLRMVTIKARTSFPSVSISIHTILADGDQVL